MAWRKVLPRVAMEYAFVTHGMLAAGALHLAQFAKTQEDRQMYQDVAATHMNIGMVQFRAEIQKVSTQNAEALFAFSTTTTIYVSKTVITDCEASIKAIVTDSDLDNTASITMLVHTVCRIFRALRGVLVVLVPCWDQIQGGPLQPIVQRDWWPPSIPVTSEEIEVDHRLRRLEKLWSRPGRTYEYSFDTLRHALKGLREVTAVVSRLLAQVEDTANGQSFDWASVIHWPVAFSHEFLTLLEQRSVEAWVILAHYAMLPQKVTDILWLDGWGTSIVTTAALVVGECNWEWIAWPATDVGLDLESLRGHTVASVQPIPRAVPEHIS